LGLANLSALVPKTAGDLPGIMPFASRRLSVSVQILPSARAHTRAPSDSNVFPFYPLETLPYFPGQFLEAGTCLTLKVETLFPLGSRPPPSSLRLHRLVVSMSYGDTALLLRINKVIAATNEAADMTSPSAWRAYRESASETIDVLTGFQLTDGRIRLFVFEGHAATFKEGAGLDSDSPSPTNGMGGLAAVLERKEASERLQGRRYLANWKLFFAQRLYTAFETPTKLFKLRQPFGELMRTPAPYIHGRVSADCVLALTRMASTLQMERLRDVHKGSLWMPAIAVLDLEKKFGDVLTVADRNGVSLAENVDTDSVESEVLTPSHADGGGGAERAKALRALGRATTDASMPESFAIALQERAARAAFDHVAHNAMPLICENPQRPRRTFEFDRSQLAAPDGQIYVYSSQRYSTTIAHKRLLRGACEEEAERTGYLRTYNKEFLAAAEIGDENEETPMVHEDSRMAQQNAPSVYVWDKREFSQTGNGWVLSKWQIKQPDAGRLAYLSLPWVEGGTQGASLSRDDRPPEGKPDFIVTNEQGGLFTKDPDFFKSIFVPDDGTSGQDAEDKAMQQYEAAQWQKKVVVADTTFYGVKPELHKGPGATARGILHDAPMKQSIKALYRSKRPLVSVVPSTILKDEEGEEFDFLKFLRPSEPDKWMATNAQTGEPEDFLLHWAQNDTELQAGGESKKPKPYAGQPTPLTEKERNDPTLFGRTKVLGEALPPRAVSQTELHGDRQRE